MINPAKIKSARMVVMGLGQSGREVACHALAQGSEVYLYDDRSLSLEELGLAQAKMCHNLNQAFDYAVVSPGIARAHTAIKQLRQQGVPLLSDIDYFLDFADHSTPIIAVTGTNGKSSVVSLLDHVFCQAGWRSKALGNIGISPITSLNESHDIHIMELSSYQLARTRRLQAKVSVCLNIAPDHLAWHGSMRHYVAAKHRIHRHSHCQVVMLDEGQTASQASGVEQSLLIRQGKPQGPDEWGIVAWQGQDYLARGDQRLWAVDQIPWTGPHTGLNALVTWAIAHHMGLDNQAIIDGLLSWPGLPYRCQYLGCDQGVDWYNDSKATNTHAQCQALNALSARYRGIVLLAGGQLKAHDYRHLPLQFPGAVTQAILFGQDRLLLKQSWQDHWSCHLAKDLTMAIQLARELAQAGMAVLFSPGGASFDAFSGYEARGRCFSDLWQKTVNPHPDEETS